MLPVSNCHVRHTQPVDVISAGPRRASSRAALLTVIVLLAAALTGAIIVAVHYRGEAAAAHRQLRLVRHPAPSRSAPPTLSSDTIALPSSGSLAGEVTIFAVRSSARLARVIVTAQITGGRPDSQYELFGGDCTGNAVNRAWAIAVTGARGSADFTGHAWTVSPSHEYYLVVGTPGLYREHPGPAVHGHFGMARGLSTVRGGIAPCAP